MIPASRLPVPTICSVYRLAYRSSRIKHCICSMSLTRSRTQFATSVFAPDVRYGISGNTPATTNITGQISVDQASPLTQALPTPTPGSPLHFSDAAGNQISTSTNTFTLTDITVPTPAQMPPITRLTLLFTMERERTN